MSVDKLNPNGILVEWNSFGLPTSTGTRRTTGTPTTIAGFPAKLTVDDPVPANAFCGGIGAEEEITAVIVTTSRPQKGTHGVTMDACLSGPRLAAEAAQVMAMLASTSIAPTALPPS